MVEVPRTYFSAKIPLIVPKNILNQIVQDQIPPVLFEKKSLDMGNGIEGDLSFSRAGEAFWSSIDGQTLELALPLRIQGRVGLKNSGLGTFFKSKVAIDRSFVPLVTFDPAISSDWKLELRDFELVDFGGKVDLRVLGFEIDLSNIVGREIRNLAAKKLGTGTNLLDLKPFATAQWSKIENQVFFLNFEDEKLGFSVHPQEVRFQEFFDSSQNLNLLLAFEGEVKSHVKEIFPRPSSIPYLLNYPVGFENKLALSLPISISFDRLNFLLKENFSGTRIPIDSRTTLSCSNFKTSAFGELVAINMDFVANQGSKKPISGAVFVVGKPFFDMQNKSFRISDVNFKVYGTNFGRQTAIGLKKRKIIRQIEKKVVIPLGNRLDESLGEIEKQFQVPTPYADFKLDQLKISSLFFYPKTAELSILVHLEGKLEVDWK